jgi:hypothetical protein
MLATVPIILDQAVGYCSHYFGLGCWLLFPLFWIRLLVTIPINLSQTGWLLLPLFWIRLLVTVPIILDQAVGYCSHYFGSCCWLLFPLFWIRLLFIVPISFDHVVGYYSHYFG